MLVSCVPKRPAFGESLANGLREDLKTAGHDVEEHDLYAEGFDPLLDSAELSRGMSLDTLVQAHSHALAASEGLVIVHPDWWGQPPAILKGWIDRVFREGLAYELAGEDGFEKEWRPLLGGKRAFVVVTSDSVDPARRELFRSIWVDAVLGDCGMEAECHFIGGLRAMGPQERAGRLASAIQQAMAFFGPRPALT